MKAIVCMLVLVLVAAVYGAEEKKNEKRGLLGLGYGLSSAPLVGHGVGVHGLDYGIGLGGHGFDYGLGGHSLGYSLGGHGLGYSLGGHGLGYSIGGHGLGYGIGSHSIVAAAPVISHSVYSAPALDHGYYGGKLGYGAPVVSLGHGYVH